VGPDFRLNSNVRESVKGGWRKTPGETRRTRSRQDDAGEPPCSLQIAGALLILAAYSLSQSGRLPSQSRSYLAHNLVGASLLGLLALRSGQWGFFLMESAWALISLRSLARHQRARPRNPRHADLEP
jgi:hypothetical protein